MAYRSRHEAAYGCAAVLDRPDHVTTWHGDRLLIGTPSIDYDQELDGRGVVLVSTLFAAPWPAIICLGEWQPAVHLRARGIRQLGAGPRSEPDDGLRQLVGATRARILRQLAAPATTTALADTIGVDAAGVSRHLHVLARVGLARSYRHGGRVLYERTAVGDALVADVRAATEWDVGEKVPVP